MGIAEQLGKTDAGFATVAAFPELRKLPIVIGEFDPEGCAACQGPSSAIATAPCTRATPRRASRGSIDLAEKHGVHLEGALTWAFEFENQPYFAGFRVLSTNGVDLPVLNVFRMLGRMGGQRLRVTSSDDPGVEAMRAGGRPRTSRTSRPSRASRAGVSRSSSGTTTTTTWRAGAPTSPSRSRACRSATAACASGTTGSTGSTATPSSAGRRWARPPSPTPEQHAELARAGQLAEIAPAAPLDVRGGKAALRLVLPRQAVSLLVLEPEP